MHGTEVTAVVGMINNPIVGESHRTGGGGGILKWENLEKLIISVRGGHCDYSPREPKNLAIHWGAGPLLLHSMQI
jgi:hypothetical protein